MKKLAQVEKAPSANFRPPKPDEISFLHFAGHVCERFDWLSPVHYLRLVFAAGELVRLSKEKPAPFNFSIHLDYLDDQEYVNALQDDLKGPIRRKLRPFLRKETLERLTSAVCPATAALLYEKPIANIGTQTYLYAMSKMTGFRDELGSIFPGSRLNSVFPESEPSKHVFYWPSWCEGGPTIATVMQMCAETCIKSRDFYDLREGSDMQSYTALEEHGIVTPEMRKLRDTMSRARQQISKASAKLHQRLGALIRVLDEYLALVHRQVRPILVDYRCTFADFLKIYAWKGFPIPDEYSGQIEERGRIKNVDYRYAITRNGWPLPQAIRYIFGDIGPLWKQEDEFLRLLSITRPSCSTPWGDNDYDQYVEDMRAQSKPYLNQEDFCTAHTLEYETAMDAIETNEIVVRSRKISSAPLVVPASFVQWADKQGFIIRKPLRMLLAPDSEEQTQVAPTKKKKGPDQRKEGKKARTKFWIEIACRALAKEDLKSPRNKLRLRDKNGAIIIGALVNYLCGDEDHFTDDERAKPGPEQQPYGFTYLPKIISEAIDAGHLK